MMRRLLGIVVGLLMLGTVTATAHADNALTVKLTTPTAQRQESANKGYADLLTEKGATNKLTFTLQNSSDARLMLMSRQVQQVRLIMVPWSTAHKIGVRIIL